MPDRAAPQLESIRAGDRRALARAITLVESQRPDDQGPAQRLLEAALPYAGEAIRVGLSGSPGVGKSTFIEAFGCHLVQLGHRVAVLAVDPSSRRSGGSIMGDKTRMEQLAASESAYIRPSPTGGTLGGVARRTREAMLLCEAAGHDVVIVETVGVGQSEVAVADMVDFFTLLILPGAGDTLQGIKRGIVELADAILVNKADANPREARRAEQDYRAALDLFVPSEPQWRPRVLRASGLKRQGVEELWQTVIDQRLALGEERIASRRQEQAVRWMHSLLRDELWRLITADSGLRRRLKRLEHQVAAGRATATAAAAELISSLSTAF